MDKGIGDPYCMYVLSQVLVVISDCFYATSMLQKNRTKLVIFLFGSDVIFGSHYLCLGAITGSLIVFTDALYLVATYFLEKHEKQKYKPTLTLTCMLAVLTITMVTWTGYICLLPMMSMLIYLTGMLFHSVAVSKFGAMIRNLLNVIYMVLLASYVGAVIETFLMLFAFVGAVMSLRHKKTKFTATVHV